MSISDQKLERFLDGYWGYGSLSAGWWFVGMEEGGELPWPEFCLDVEAWCDTGAPAMRPLRPEVCEREDNRWFGQSPKLQPYWEQLSRIHLAAMKRPTDVNAVRAYQANELAAPESDTCLLELLPLRSPSTDDWVYGEHSDLDILRTRRAYTKHMRPKRIAALRSLIARHMPKVVVFAGLGCRNSWNEISGKELPTHPEKPVQISNTTYVVVRHPNMRGVKNAYFEEMGRAIAESQLSMRSD